MAADTFVVIGDTTVARRVCSSLAQRGHEMQHVPGPDDDELRERVFENRQVRASRLVMVVIMARWTMASWWSGLVS